MGAVKPKFVQVCRKRGERYVYFRNERVGYRRRLPSLPFDDDRFVREYDLAMEEMERLWLDARHPQRIDSADKFLRKVLAKAKNRADVLGVPYDLSEEWLLALVREQGYRCALTGIAFELKFSDRGRKRPFAPSIDRIVTEIGYVQTNVRLVTQIANYARSCFSDDEFYRMCHAASSSRRICGTPLLSNDSNFYGSPTRTAKNVDSKG